MLNLNLNLREPAILHGTTLIDDVYCDPEAVRTLALNSTFTYRLDTVTYPGSESYVDTPQWNQVWEQLRQRYVPDARPDSAHKKQRFKQGKFRVAAEADGVFRPDGVHQDVQRWTGVIYLTEERHCQEGVGYYEHIPTSARSEQDPRYTKFIQDAISGLDQYEAYAWKRAHQRDLTNWRLLSLIPMKFNRLVLVDGHRFHATMKCFGDKPSNSRLTQHFEFY